MIKSLCSNQGTILDNIAHLHTNKKIDLDITYSRGIMWNGSRYHPMHTLDSSQYDLLQGLPIKDNSVTSIMFDPPFLVKYNPEQAGLLGARFGCCRTINDLWTLYKIGVRECFRVLSLDGKLITKTQDISPGRWLVSSTSEMYNFAIQAGFRCIDRFVFEATHMMPTPARQKVQRHARKNHTNFWVFERPNSFYNYPEESGIAL